MQATAPSSSDFSWLRELVIPVVFTILGAAVGLWTSQFRDDEKAKRAKASFMRAIGLELDALGNQLDDSLREVQESTKRVRGGDATGPHFAFSLRTSVFTSQVGKLRDVDGTLTIRLIHFYSDLGTLQRILESVNDMGVEYTGAEAFHGQKEAAKARLMSGLIVLQGQMLGFIKRLRDVRAELPAAHQGE